jgi:DNA-binding CsgD family transcriptional regulator
MKGARQKRLNLGCEAVAGAVSIAESTAKTHLRSILKKRIPAAV